MIPPFSARIVPSRICLGTGSFGSEIDKAASFAVLDAYIEAGGNFLDTAHIYAAWVENGWGASECTIGEWLRVHGARDAVVIGTKGAHPPLDNMAHARCARADIEQDLNESLERLGVDCVDVYWLHRDDLQRPAAEIIETLAELVKSGRVRSLGVSNWTWARIEAANVYAQQHQLPAFAGSQPGWSLAAHPGASPVSGMLYLDEPMWQWHVKTGLPIAAYSSQAKGYFGTANASWAKNGFSGNAPRGAEYDCPANRRRLQTAIALARDKGCAANQVALAYLLHQPFPVYPIIGTSTPAHVREAIEALSVSLSPEECAALRGPQS